MTRRPLEQIQRVHEILSNHGGNKTAAARDLKWTRSKLRRFMAANNISVEARSPSEISKIETEKKKIKAERTHIRALIDDLHEQSEWAKLVQRVVNKGVDRFEISSPSAGSDSHAAVALLSDIHYGEVVDPASVSMMNEYDKNIANERVKRFFSNIIRAQKYVELDVDEFYLIVMGDLISGEIHEELARTNQISPVECVRNVASLLSSGVDALSESFSRVKVVCVGGNHGRIDRKPQSKGKGRRSFDWLACSYACDVNQSDAQWYLADSADTNVEIKGTKFLITHGDGFRGGSGIAGSLSPLMLGDHRLRKRAMSSGSPHDWMLCGHFHQLMLGYSGIIMNGSIVGDSEYTHSKIFKHEIPQQAMFFVNEEHGVTLRLPIFVQEED